MKTFLIQNSHAKPCKLQGSIITHIEHVRVVPLNELITDLLAMDYELTKHKIFDDGDCEILVARENGERVKH